MTEMEAMERTSLDRESALYARDIADRLEAILGKDLIGVYLHGSAVLGDFSRSRSDDCSTLLNSVAYLDNRVVQLEPRLGPFWF